MHRSYIRCGHNRHLTTALTHERIYHRIRASNGVLYFVVRCQFRPSMVYIFTCASHKEVISIACHVRGPWMKTWVARKNSSLFTAIFSRAKYRYRADQYLGVFTRLACTPQSGITGRELQRVHLQTHAGVVLLPEHARETRP